MLQSDTHRVDRLCVACHVGKDIFSAYEFIKNIVFFIKRAIAVRKHLSFRFHSPERGK